MAVYHPISDQDLRELAASFGFELLSATAIPEGSINTNYDLATDGGRFFLRFSRVRSEADLAFEAALLEHLRRAHLPVPEPRHTPPGAVSLAYAGGRVSLFPYLPGEQLSSDQVTADHGFRIGEFLGRSHTAGASFSGERPNPYGPTVVRGWLEALVASGGEGDEELLAVLPELGAALEEAVGGMAGLPRGPIHADLFRDNVKWLGGRISAVFDWEMACVGPYMLDLGIAFDVWCFGDREFDRSRAHAFVEGYRSARQAVAGELSGLYAEALFGAVRYTLSRIRDFHLSPLGQDRLRKKDYRRYLARVRALRVLGPAGLQELCGL